jgi:hypothetical protein
MELMKDRVLGASNRSGWYACIAIAVAAGCSSKGQDGTTDPYANQAPSGRSGSTSSASGSTGDSSGDSSGSGSGSGSSGSTPSSGQPDAAAEPEAGDDSSDSSEPDGNTSCVKGQVTPNEVVMLGDSYLDPAWGNIGPTLMMEAGAMYRHYYIGAASMAWGNPNTQFYIPYQFDPMALTDTSVPNPSDIKVVITDGGGNDVLIGNTSCETTAPPANTSCAATIQAALDKASSMIQEGVQKGVKSLIYFFYPHLSTAGGGILQMPAPAVNETLDYAYPLAEKVCCGTSFTSSITNYSCVGHPTANTSCVFIDVRPAFEGHLADYIKSDNVHPTQAGAQVIADLIWKQMQAHCIAQ